MNLHLYRAESTPDGVFGRLSGAGLALHTVEEDWKDNRPRVSCIPAGTYTIRRSVWHKKGLETFEVSDVPGRSRILFHPANTEEDLEGCIGLGMRRGWVTVAKDEDTGEQNVEKRAVVESRKAFRHFMDALGSVDHAQLVVEWASGLP